MDQPRVLFLHGLEGTALGTKVMWLRAAGFDVIAPVLPTDTVKQHVEARTGPLIEAAFAEALEAATQAIRESTPDLIVGSSFGGGLTVEVMHRGLWAGPVVLLAPAARKLFGREHLPVGHHRAVVIHGRRDDVVPVEDSLVMAAGCSREVQLWLVDDDHRLTSSVGDGVVGRAIRAVLA